MTALLDADVLIALTVADHVHHDLVEQWFDDAGGGVATCPTTQGALVRFLLRGGAGAREAVDVLHALTTSPRHESWADDLPFDTGVDLRGVIGHRQVTGAYLVALAGARGGRLVTLDRGLLALRGDVVELLDAGA